MCPNVTLSHRIRRRDPKYGGNIRYITPYFRPDFSSGSRHAGRGKLFQVAKYQRWVMQCVLANILSLVVSVLSFSQVIVIPPRVHPVFGFVLIVIASLMIISAFQLANQFYSDLISIICALAMWVPGLSLIVLLIINQKATGYLKENGIKVGLMGASRKQI
jgi:hypothetical protein